MPRKLLVRGGQSWFIETKRYFKEDFIKNSKILFSDINTISEQIARYPDNCTPRKIAPRLGLGFGSRLGLVLGLGGNQTIAPEENCPRLGLGFGLGLVLGLEGNFPLGQLS